MRNLLLQLDGKLPNLALIRLAAHLRGQGEHVDYQHLRSEKSSLPGTLFGRYDRVFASAIFEKTRPIVRRLLDVYPSAVVGGSGWDEKITMESIGVPESTPPDYSDFPSFSHSMGFTQRGCRLKCSFCKVATMEGKVRKASRAVDIWRGDPWPKNLLLLDNDFFGEPSWRDEVEAIRAGGFRVSFNQGFNIRLIGDEEAAAIATLDYSNEEFKDRRLYTAWDNARDEDLLFLNLERLVKYGVRPDDILVYMLIGYDHRTKSARPNLTADDFYRHDRLREFGCRPYPMPFVKNRELNGFQRWIVKRIDCFVSWDEFKRARFRPEKVGIADDAPLFSIG